jgi:HK97 family phage portal protein
MFKKLQNLLNGQVEQKANPAGGANFNFSPYAPVDYRQPKFACEGYSQNPTVFAVIDGIATAAANIDIDVMLGDKVAPDTHELVKLLKAPNPTQDKIAFFKNLCVDYLVFGESFTVGTGIQAPSGAISKTAKPSELWNILPTKMDVKAGPSGLPRGYEVKLGTGGTKFFPYDQTMGFSAIDHSKTYNPTNIWRGLSPMSAAGMSIDLHNLSMSWNNSLVKNGARPSGAYTTESELSNSAYERAKEQVNNTMSGTNNVGKTYLFEGMSKYFELGKSPKDMDFNSSLKTTDVQIALVYSYPLPLLTVDASTLNNLEKAYEMLYENTAIPLMEVFLRSFNNWLAPRYGDNVTIQIDMESISALEAKRDRKVERQLKAVAGSVITINEARENLKLERLPDAQADSILVQQTLSTLGMVDADLVASPESEPVDEEKFADKLREMKYTDEEIEAIEGK